VLSCQPAAHERPQGCTSGATTERLHPPTVAVRRNSAVTTTAWLSRNQLANVPSRLLLKRSLWALAPPPDNFTLEFDENRFDYTFEVGGAVIAWKDQVQEDTPPPTVRDWEGLAQPTLIQGEYRGPAGPDRFPRDFLFTYQHAHRFWLGANDFGDGNPWGRASGPHLHRFNGGEWVSAGTNDNDPNEFGLFAPHYH
jgi:hypothetical protein